MGLNKYKFPNLNSIINMPKIDLATSVINPTPKLPTVNIKPVSIIERLNNENLIREIDQLTYQLDLLNSKKRILELRKKALVKNIKSKSGIVLFVVTTFLSVIIPFLLSIFIELFNNEKGKSFLVCYLIISFTISMLLMFTYLIKSYQNLKKDL